MTYLVAPLVAAISSFILGWRLGRARVHAKVLREANQKLARANYKVGKMLEIAQAYENIRDPILKSDLNINRLNELLNDPDNGGFSPETIKT